MFENGGGIAGSARGGEFKGVSLGTLNDMAQRCAEEENVSNAFRPVGVEQLVQLTTFNHEIDQDTAATAGTAVRECDRRLRAPAVTPRISGRQEQDRLCGPISRENRIDLRRLLARGVKPQRGRPGILLLQSWRPRQFGKAEI